MTNIESPTPDYDRMLEQIDTGIEDLRERIEADEIEDHRREQIRLKQYRTLGYLIRTKRQVLKDKTLEELAEEIEQLKNEREVGSVSID
ncbi:hypothetical protein [Natronorarus salvus]|uniref:hypothetical protein n=1 Tax=Natronorarus salvus TaxID=3117733 RepID=UPI002F26C5B8